MQTFIHPITRRQVTCGTVMPFGYEAKESVVDGRPSYHVVNPHGETVNRVRSMALAIYVAESDVATPMRAIPIPAGV
jgi:hypothetical protein